jgi:hypothetical protein
MRIPPGAWSRTAAFIVCISSYLPRFHVSVAADWQRLIIAKTRKHEEHARFSLLTFVIFADLRAFVIDSRENSSKGLRHISRWGL